MSEGARATGFARRRPPPAVPPCAAHDRENPSIADVILYDQTQPLSDQARRLVARDLRRWSHRALLPVARAVSLGSVFVIRLARALLPDAIERRLRHHGALDVL